MESNAEYNNINLIDMTLILSEFYGLQIYKMHFCKWSAKSEVNLFDTNCTSIQ